MFFTNRWRVVCFHVFQLFLHEIQTKFESKADRIYGIRVKRFFCNLRKFVKILSNSALPAMQPILKEQTTSGFICFLQQHMVSKRIGYRVYIFVVNRQKTFASTWDTSPYKST